MSEREALKRVLARFLTHREMYDEATDAVLAHLRARGWTEPDAAPGGGA